jgi:pimeloyl-ACP methyl ester carboxylesterase
MKKHLLLPLALAVTACSPGQRQLLPANEILPVPAPRAPLSHWTATATRIPIEVATPGATLRGWTFQPSARQRLRILFFNGNAMTVDESQSLYRDLAVRGADVTAFDYRGYGFSTGKPDVMDFRRDALVLYDKLADSGPVIVYGFSMGTAMACYVASQRPARGLILAGSIATAQEEFPVFARAEGMSAHEIANVLPAQDAISAFDEKSLVAQSKAPLLMLHGESDTLTPIEQGREVFAASPSTKKTFIAIPGATHNETTTSPAALKAIQAFLFSQK